MTWSKGAAPLFERAVTCIEGAAVLIEGAAPTLKEAATCEGFLGFLVFPVVLTVVALKVLSKLWHLRSTIDLNQTLPEHNSQDLFPCGCFHLQR